MRRQRKKYADEKKHKVAPIRPKVGPLTKQEPLHKPEKSEASCKLTIALLKGSVKN